MTYRREFQMKGNTWAAIAVLVLVFIGVFFVARGLFWLLNILAPVMLIATLIIDYKVLVGYGKWIVGLVRRDLLLGLGAILLTLVGYPVVLAFLLGKALMNRKVRQLQKESQKKAEGEWVDFEELESKKKDSDWPVLPPKETREKNDYEDLFR